MTVTGSHIAQSVGETALPIQIITREDIERSGVTSVEQVLERVPAIVNPVNQALSVGNGTSPGLSAANLRGLGSGSTLVLLNGRRLANYAFDGEAVDLNAIPLAAIARIEILKDGASAIYGADAIGGVINFILRKDYQGLDVSGNVAITQHGGGNSGKANLAYGIGDPARDGYNLFAMVSYQKDEALRAIDRDFARTAYRPEAGILGLNAFTFPANIVDRVGQRYLNPSLADGCAPPFSIPFAPLPFLTPACGYDYAPAIDLLPESERVNTLLRGMWRITPAIDLFAEALVARNRFDVQTAQSSVPPGTLFGQNRYPAGGPFYPAEFAAANGLSGSLLLGYRTIELGPRRSTTRSDAQRYVLGVEGEIAGWDFDVAGVYSENRQEIEYLNGFIYTSKLIPAMATGLINPFGPSGPEGRALLESVEYTGTPQTSKAETTLISGFASREIGSLATGPLAVALGTELRTERLSYQLDPALRSGDPLLGAPPQSKSGSRDVIALFTEFSVPLLRNVEVQVAVRHDDYSDFGATTNPKVALRWQAAPAVMFRGSWGKGFRAPPLYSLYEPKRALGPTPFEDPVRCPATSSIDDRLAIAKTFGGGNPDLDAETSTQWNAGVVWEPARGLSLSADWWRVEKEGAIGPLDEIILRRYYDTFRGRVTRGPIDPAFPDLPGPIVAIDFSPINLGMTRTSGVDVTLDWRSTALDAGVFRLGVQGTYVTRWETQFDGATFVSMLGDATYGAAVPRWRGVVTLDWTRGAWGATVSNNYSSGYRDQNPRPDLPPRDVASYSTWDLQGRYSGANWRIAAGIRNLFDTDPPLSNQGNTFQVGFNPVAASPLGRVFYLRGGYQLQ